MDEKDEPELRNEHTIPPNMNTWDEIEYELWMLQSDAEMIIRKLNQLRKLASEGEDTENER